MNRLSRLRFPSFRLDRRTAAGLALAVAVFLGSWALLHLSVFSPNQLGDTPVYQDYGYAMRVREVPYRDFSVEYPPGALVAFLAPTFFTSNYSEEFGWLMAACGVASLLFVALARATRPAVAFVAVSPLLIGSLAFSRFDFYPTAFVVAAIAAFARDRHGLGWAALGAAFAIKLFAAALVPLALIWTLRRRGPSAAARGLAIWIAVVEAAFIPFLIASPHGLWKSVSGQLSRPLQIESLGASFLMTFGHPHVIATHGSLNLSGHGAIGASLAVLSLATMAALWISFARGPADPERFMRYSAACICAFVAFGKVLSPQFLIWLVPIVPLTRGRRGIAATALLAAALVDTEVWFPSRYYGYVYHQHLAWLVLVRDLLLVALLAVLSLPARGRLRTR